MATHRIDPDAVLAGARLKVYRARDLLDTLMSEIDRVLTTPSSGRPQANADGTFSSIYRPSEEPHPLMSIVLGEFAHNARSALDNVVSALVVRNNGIPRSHHKFPLMQVEAEWQGSVAAKWPDKGPLANVGPEDFDLIEAAQPFHAEDPARHPLALLGRINNADKHAMLHAAGAYSAAVGQDVIRVEPATSPVEIVWTREPLTPLTAGDEQTRYRFLGPVPEQWTVYLNWPLAVQFADHHGDRVHHWELADVFNAVVRTLIPWLDPD